MSTSEFVLATMVMLVSGFAVATLCDEYLPAIRKSLLGVRAFRQTGDSSLGPRSVNWLAAMALVGALLIGVVFR